MFALADGTPLSIAGYSVRPVPIPATFLLLGSSLLGLGASGLRRWRKRQ